MNKNQNFLRLCNMRIAGIYDTNSPELFRMEAARNDIISRMSAEELEDFSAMTAKVLSPAEKAKLAKEEELAMAANVDKPSI